jgi:hypothetical protein
MVLEKSHPIQSYHQQMNTCLIALMHELQWDLFLYPGQKKARDDDCSVYGNRRRGKWHQVRAGRWPFVRPDHVEISARVAQ